MHRSGLSSEVRETLPIVPQLTEIIRKKNLFYQAIDGLYGIELQALQTSDWGKNNKLTPVLATDYLMPYDFYIQRQKSFLYKAPVIFSYREAFEYHIRKINHLYFTYGEVVIQSDPMSAFISNLDHINKKTLPASDLWKEESSFISQRNVILYRLKEKGILHSGKGRGCTYFVEVADESR